jgi:threonylcarbamoyladenosine tRNA methylthiotransferase MtaB
LSYLHVFPFSAREGTPAARMRPRVQEEVKAARARVLREMSARRWREYVRSFTGQTLRAVVIDARDGDEDLGKGQIPPGFSRCLTANYIDVVIEGTDLPRRRLIDVSLTGMTDGEFATGTVAGAGAGR